MDKLVDAVMRNLPKACLATGLSRYSREFIEQRLVPMFPVFETPDHPPYSLMIQQAIKNLKEEGGSSEDSISKCIASEYDGLSWAHDSLLSHHLRKLSDRGEIVCTSDDRYALPFSDGEGSVPPISTKGKFKRVRGKKRGMHVQNKKLKRECSPEGRDLEAELNVKQLSTEIEADFGRDETSQPDMRINLQESELATKENTPDKGNEQDSLSQAHATREANQAAEIINGEPVVEMVQVSEEQYTTTGQTPMLQDVRVADHDESDEQHIQLHDVIMTQRDPVDELTVTVEGATQSLVDSESRTAEEPPRQSEADDFPMRCDSTEDRSKVVEGQSKKSQSSELIFQGILMLQKQLRDLAICLMQLEESPGNGTLPRENVVEVYRRNREIGLIFQEMLEDSPEPFSGLLNQTMHEGKAGVPSKDLSTVGNGAAGVRFPLLWCQKQDRPPLFLDSCPSIPDDAAKDSEDLSSGEQKQPELSNQQTQSREQDILLQHSGDKLLDSPYMCVVALPVLGRPEKTSEQPQPDHKPGQLEGAQTCALPPQGQVMGLNGGTNKVLPSVFTGEQACADELTLQCDNRLEQGFELSKSHNGREDDAGNSSFCAEQIEKYPAVSDEHEDPIHGRPVTEPPDKPLELPTPEGAEVSSQIESHQTATESMNETGDDGFSWEGQSDFARVIPEQPRQNALERDNTITIASSNPGPPAVSTSTNPSILEKKRDKTYINIEYREKLRSPAIHPETRSTTDGPTSDNPLSPAIHPEKISTMDGPTTDSPLSPAIHPGTRSTRDGPTSDNSSQYPVMKKRRGRPRKMISPQETMAA